MNINNGYESYDFNPIDPSSVSISRYGIVICITHDDKLTILTSSKKLTVTNSVTDGQASAFNSNGDLYFYKMSGSDYRIIRFTQIAISTLTESNFESVCSLNIVHSITGADFLQANYTLNPYLTNYFILPYDNTGLQLFSIENSLVHLKTKIDVHSSSGSIKSRVVKGFYYSCIGTELVRAYYDVNSNTIEHRSYSLDSASYGAVTAIKDICVLNDFRIVILGTKSVSSERWVFMYVINSDGSLTLQSSKLLIGNNLSSIGNFSVNSDGSIVYAVNDVTQLNMLGIRKLTIGETGFGVVTSLSENQLIPIGDIDMTGHRSSNYAGRGF